jgi:hypothetical protein
MEERTLRPGVRVATAGTMCDDNDANERLSTTGHRWMSPVVTQDDLETEYHRRDQWLLILLLFN